MTLPRIASRQTGVALISVLISVVILGFIMAALIAQTQAHIRQMEAVKARVNAEVQVESELQRLLFLYAGEMEHTIDGWNYHGSHFRLADNVQVKIKDSASMAAINNSITYTWRLLLPALGYSDDEAKRLLACLEDWQDRDNLKKLHGGEARYYQIADKPGPRNGFIQTEAELELVCGFKPDSAALIREDVTFIGETYFNPLTASRRLVDQLGVGPRQRDSLLQTREDHKDTLLALAQTLQFEGKNSLWRYERPQRFEIEIILQVGNAEARRSVVFNHNLRYNSAPIFQFWRWQE